MAHPKGVLLERAAKLGLSRPEFRTERTGPEHEPLFLTDVIVDGEVLGTGQGGSKRTAEKYAADEALAALEAREGAGTASGKRGKATAGAGAGPAGKRPDRAGGGQAGKRPAKARSDAVEAASVAAAEARAESEDEQEDEREYQQEDEMASEQFEGPWPMIDDLLAAVLAVAEKRVAADLRGEAARVAIRDFSLDLYKELLSDLGDVVEEEDGDEEEDD